MKRRSLLQSLATVPAAGLLRAQQPVVPPKPTPVAIEEIPVIESTIPDIAAVTLPTFFSETQFRTLAKLCDLIAPQINDVPGALAGGAPQFLDFLLGQSPGARQTLYREGLDGLNKQSEQRFHVPFDKSTKAQADELLAPLCKQWTFEAPDEFAAFLRTAKQDILSATENSYEWIQVMSRRVRSANGVGMYWFPIENL